MGNNYSDFSISHDLQFAVHELLDFLQEVFNVLCLHVRVEDFLASPLLDPVNLIITLLHFSIKYGKLVIFPHHVLVPLAVPQVDVVVQSPLFP